MSRRPECTGAVPTPGAQVFVWGLLALWRAVGARIPAKGLAVLFGASPTGHFGTLKRVRSDLVIVGGHGAVNREPVERWPAMAYSCSAHDPLRLPLDCGRVWRASWERSCTVCHPTGAPCRAQSNGWTGTLGDIDPLDTRLRRCACAEWAMGGCGRGSPCACAPS